MNYSGNMPDWHQYNSTQPGINDVTSTNQNANSGHLAFVSSISPTSLNGLNLSSEGIEKHQNDPNYSSRHFQSLGNISNVPNGTESNPLASMVQMQNCIGHYGPTGARNPMESLNSSIDPRNSSITTINEELGYRNNQVPLNGPVAHLAGPNVAVNGSTSSIGPRNNTVGNIPPGRQGPPSFIPCKGLCCNPEPNIGYQQWEKYGHYQANASYRENIRAPGYTADNRRYGGDFNFRKDAYENKEVVGPMMPNVDHRRNFPDYTKYRKDSAISRTYPSSSGMLQNYPVQNYNYTGEYQKYPYGIKEYSKMGNVGLSNPGILKHQEQSFFAQQKYNNKQMQYQNGGMVPKGISTSNVNSNVISPVQSSYCNPQFSRGTSNELPRDCQEVADSASSINRMQSAPIHGAHSQYQTYQQKIAMQRFSMENHLREFTRIPGYQTHPKYKECILRYREILKLQQSVEYQNAVQQTPRVETPVSTTVPPINLQFDQNGMLINSNYLVDGFQRLQQTLNPNSNIENTEKHDKGPTSNVSNGINQDVQHSSQLNNTQNKDSASLCTDSLQSQEQHAIRKDLDQSEYQLQKTESDNLSVESPSGTMHTKISKEFADKPELDVRQFLANWDESEDEDATSPNLSVVLNDSMPVVVVDYENVNLSAETGAVNNSKQETFCPTEVNFEVQNTEKEGLTQECLTISYSTADNIDTSKSCHEETVTETIKPGGIIHCISNDPNEIPTIHIVDNVEISDILEVPAEPVVKVIEQEQSAQFFEQNSNKEATISSLADDSSKSKKSCKVSEKYNMSLETVNNEGYTRQESETSKKNQTTEEPLSILSKHSIDSSQSSNLKKQSSFTSEESHNPDDISLPDLPTSECTPISTTLNTPIHSDSEESSEQVEDLTISTNPIEIIQNSPLISFTHSPVKIEPYQLDNKESEKHKLHNSLDFDFREENHSKSNASRKTVGHLNLDNTELSVGPSKTESASLRKMKQEKNINGDSVLSKKDSANNRENGNKSLDPCLSLTSVECETDANVQNNKSIHGCKNSDIADSTACPTSIKLSRYGNHEKLTTIESSKTVSQKNNLVKIISDKTGHFVDSIRAAPRIIEDRVGKESSKCARSADSKADSEKERMRSLKEYRRIKARHFNTSERQMEIISKNKDDCPSKLHSKSLKALQSPQHDELLPSVAKHTICLQPNHPEIEELEPERKQAFSRSFVTKNMNTDFEIQVTNVNLKIKDNNDIRKQLLTLREKNKENATDGIKIEINLSCTDHTGEKLSNKDGNLFEECETFRTSSNMIECRKNHVDYTETKVDGVNKKENESKLSDSATLSAKQVFHDSEKTENTESIMEKSQHKSTGQDKDQLKSENRNVKRKFSVESQNKSENTFHKTNKIHSKESSEESTLCTKNNESVYDIIDSSDNADIIKAQATDTKEHMAVLASVKNSPDISLSKQFKSRHANVRRNETHDSISYFSQEPNVIQNNSCNVNTCSASSTSVSHTANVSVKNLEYENPLKLDFDHFDIGPNESVDDKDKEKEKRKNSQMESLDNNEDIYKGISGFINPAFTSIDDLQNLDTVPVYTTKDGKITYSPNPRFTYRVLIMEARKREGYSSVRKPHYKDNYFGYPSPKRWLKEAHNSSTFNKKRSSQSNESKNFYETTSKQSDKCEKSTDTHKGHSYCVKNKNVTFLEYYNDGASKKYNVEDDEDESIIFNNKNLVNDFKHNEKKQYDKNVLLFNPMHQKSKLLNDSEHNKKNGMSLTPDADLLDKRNKDTLEFYECYRPQNTEENISNINDLGFHDIDPFPEEIPSSKPENSLIHESFTSYEKCKDMPKNLFDETDVCKDDELEKTVCLNEDENRTTDKPENDNIDQKHSSLNDLEIPSTSSDSEVKSTEKTSEEISPTTEESDPLIPEKNTNDEILKSFSENDINVRDELFVLPGTDKQTEDVCDDSSKSNVNYESNDEPPKLCKEVEDEVNKFDEPPTLNKFEDDNVINRNQEEIILAHESVNDHESNMTTMEEAASDKPSDTTEKTTLNQTSDINSTVEILNKENDTSSTDEILLDKESRTNAIDDTHEKQIENIEHNKITVPNEILPDQSCENEPTSEVSVERKMEIDDNKKDQSEKQEIQTEYNTEYNTEESKTESSDVKLSETKNEDSQPAININDNLNKEQEHVNDPIENCSDKHKLKNTERTLKNTEHIEPDNRITNEPERENNLETEPEPTCEQDDEQDRNHDHEREHKYEDKPEHKDEHEHDSISGKPEEKSDHTSQNMDCSEDTCNEMERFKNEPLTLDLEQNSLPITDVKTTEESDAPMSSTDMPVLEPLDTLPPDITSDQYEINTNDELIENTEISSTHETSKETKQDEENVNENCYVSTCEPDALRNLPDLTEESESRQCANSVNAKVVPKIVIKKVELSPKVITKQGFALDTDSDSTVKRSKTGSKHSLYPKIPKMIIRKSSSRPGTPTIKDADSEISSKSHDADEIFEVKSESSKDEDDYTEDSMESIRSQENKVLKMKIRFGSKSPKNVSRSNNVDSSVKYKDNKKSIEKLKYKKSKTEMMQNDDTSREDMSIRDYHDEQKKEKLPKLKLRKHETEKPSSAEIARKRSNSNSTDIPNKRYRKSEKDDSKQSIKPDENSSKERETKRNSHLRISEKIPKVIIKRSSATSEFKCELSKDRKNAIVKSAKWQPEVKLQRCQMIDRMVEEFQKSRSSFAENFFKDSNYKHKTELEDERHNSHKLSRSSSASNLSPVKRKQRRMSDYEYGRSKDLDMKKNEMNVESVSNTKTILPKDRNTERKRLDHKDKQGITSNTIDVELKNNCSKKDKEQIGFEENHKDTDESNAFHKISSEEKDSDRVDLSLKLKEMFRTIRDTRSTTDVSFIDEFHTEKFPAHENNMGKDKFVCNIDRKFLIDSFRNEEIESRIKLKTESINPSDIEENANQEDPMKSFKSTDSIAFNDNTVIKIDSSDDSQTTIEILPASPDVSQNEVPNCELDDGENERVYLGDAIPTQFELELEITDNSNVDTLDVSMPKLKEMIPYVSDSKSNQSTDKSNFDGKVGETEAKELSKRIAVKRKHDDYSTPLKTQTIPHLDSESVEIYRAVEKETNSGDLWCNDPLIKEVLAAKETLKKFLSKPINDKTKCKGRLKTAAEKKQGSSFDLNGRVDILLSEMKHIKRTDGRVFDKTLEHKIGNRSKTEKHDDEKSEKMHSKQEKSSSNGKRVKTKSLSKSDENPCSTYSFTHSINDPPMMQDFTISLKESKCLSKNGNPRKNSDVTNKDHNERSSEDLVKNVEVKSKGIPYKIPKISRSRDEQTDQVESIKGPKTKEDNMPVLEPEVSLNFDPTSDRDSSRSPPVITNQESVDVEDTKTTDEKCIASDDKFEKDEKEMDKRSEMTLADIVSQLAYHEKATIRHRRYCTLCEKWFPTTSRHRRHLAGYQHRHIELTQRRTIHALFMLFTGKPCPRLLPANIVRSDCCIGELTPLQIAVQDVAKGTKQTEPHPWKSNDIDKSL